MGVGVCPPAWGRSQASVPGDRAARRERWLRGSIPSPSEPAHQRPRPPTAAAGPLRQAGRTMPCCYDGCESTDMSRLMLAFRLSSHRRGHRGLVGQRIKRVIVCRLPDCFHALCRMAQEKVLQGARAIERNALGRATGRHGRAHRTPARPGGSSWGHEPERFLEDTVVFSPVRSVRSMRRDALMFAPAAFLRRGAVSDPRDVDSRRGETEEWVT